MDDLYFGPYVWLIDPDPLSEGHRGWWDAPEYARPVLDYRPLPEQATAATYGDKPYGVFRSSRPLGSDYERLGRPEDKVNGRTRQMVSKQLGVRVDGESVADLLWDALTSKAAPDGSSNAKPIMPGSERFAELHLQSFTRRRRLRLFDKSAHANRCVDVIRNSLLETPHKEVDKVLGCLLLKHEISFGDARSWKKLLPAEMREHFHPRRPTTSYSDDFDRADEALEASANWTDMSGTTALRIVSNELQLQSDSANQQGFYRYEQDLSSDDHVAEIEIVTFANSVGGTRLIAAASRMIGTTDETCYNFWAASAATGSPDPYYQHRKTVAGVRTNLLARTAWTQSLPEVFKCQSDGSTQKAFIDASEKNSSTDTAITGYTRGGIRSYTGGTSNPESNQEADNFQIADLVSATTARLIRGGLIRGGKLISGKLIGV